MAKAHKITANKFHWEWYDKGGLKLRMDLPWLYAKTMIEVLGSMEIPFDFCKPSELRPTHSPLPPEYNTTLLIDIHHLALERNSQMISRLALAASQRTRGIM